jgi:uncharacterized repeat protein (TIGR03837 family)
MAPLDELLAVWERAPRQVVVAVPEVALLAPVLSRFGAPDIAAGRAIRRGALELRVLPFLPQARYDELLWACDFNFVRGEDSFVRAQWAARPFVWHIYPQEAHAHWAKLEAFLELYCAPGSGAACAAASAFMKAWNGVTVAQGSLNAAWASFVAGQHALCQHGRAWADRITRMGELADNLASFCAEKLK